MGVLKIEPNDVLGTISDTDVRINEIHKVKPFVESNMTELPFEFSDVDTVEEAKEKVRALVQRYSGCFMKSKEDRGLVAEEYAMEIETGDHPPVYIRQWKSQQAQSEAMKEILDRMHQAGQIEETNSPWNSPVFLVPKPDKSWRFVQDLRGLNKIIKRDEWPIPNIQVELDRLRGSKYFTKIDLSSAFWQIPIRKDSREKTAFTAAGKHWQNKVVPMGLGNSPAALMRVMLNILKDFLDEISCYMDDILIWDQTIDGCLEKTERILRRLSEVGFKISGKKSCFCVQQVDYLGHQVSEKGLSVGKDKVAEEIEFYATSRNQVPRR